MTATPDELVALPDCTRRHPHDVRQMNDAAGDCIFGLRSRLIAYAKLCAVTVCAGIELVRRAPLLTVNMYVLPSFETRGKLVASLRLRAACRPAPACPGS